MRRVSPLALAALGALSIGAAATQASPSNEELPQVRVEGKGAARSLLNGPSTTLQGDELRNKAAATLGATLQDELGVANSSFGPNVGLPIIRGQGGSRVRAMVGGGGAHDASSLSADHGVMVESGLAQSITVHRGPSAIRFGGDAIGGAVEIDYGRIPVALPRGLQGRSEVRLGGDSELALTRAEGSLKESSAAGARTGLVWHLDAHGRRKSAAKIPGWAIDEDAVKRQFFLVSGNNSFGYIPNSDARGHGGGAGLSAIFDGGFIGASAGSMDINYGLPPGAHSHSHGGVKPVDEAAEAQVRIQAEQQRFDINAEIALPWAAAQRLKLKLGDTRYRHDELNNGISETKFRNDVQEARLELEHSFGLGHSGSAGVHLQQRDFSALGVEAFVPKTRVSGGALYLLERYDSKAWALELGLRADHRDSRPESQPTSFGIDVALPQRRFTFGNMSLAATRKFEQGSLTLTHWQASRAPDVQELYALGPHIATRTYDFGNSALELEKLSGWNLSFQQQWGATSLQASAFRYAVDDHIYQRSLGVFYAADKKQFRAMCAQLDQCLPVTRYEQSQAKFHGFEAELAQELLSGAQQHADSLLLALFADQVRGRLSTLHQDVPRQPAARFGLRMEAAFDHWHVELRGVRSLAQNRPGENETASPASYQLHASLRWTGTIFGEQLASFYLLGRNLTNQEVRNSTSFLRNYAPEPGRTVELGAELRY
jgi:iron complex outermembrane receptor protein